MLLNKLAGLCITLVSSLTAASPILPTPQAASFAADPSINAEGLFAAAKKSQNDVLASFGSGQGGPKVKIYGDWETLPGVSAIHFIADMDVDCDGVDVRLSWISKILSEPNLFDFSLPSSSVLYVPNSALNSCRILKNHLFSTIQMVNPKHRSGTSTPAKSRFMFSPRNSINSNQLKSDQTRSER